MDNKMFILQRDNSLEVIGEGKIGVLKEDKGGVLYKDLSFEPMNKATLKNVLDYKKQLRQELVSYYKKLLSGEEKLLVLKTEDENILTSETLLNKGWETPKYGEVFESAFYAMSLEKIGIKSKVVGFHSVQEKASSIKIEEESLTLVELMGKVA